MMMLLFVPEREKMCVFYCTLFRFIVPSFTVLLWLGILRKKGFLAFLKIENRKEEGEYYDQKPNFHHRQK